METVLLAIHITLVVSLVLVILIQRTSNDGLSGLGGGSAGAGAGAIFSARGSANFLTRATAFLATGFICTSLALAYLASHTTGGSSIADSIAAEEKGKPAVVKPAVPAEVPAKPAAPSVPMAQ